MQGQLPGERKEREVAPAYRGDFAEEALTCPALPVWGSGSVRIWTPTLLRRWPLQGPSTGRPCSVYPLSRALGAGQGVRHRGSF